MFLQDLRHAFRSLYMARGFACAAILSLALGIGGNVAMFSLVNTVLLKPLPYREPERLVLITEVIPKVSKLFAFLPVMGGHVLRWRKEVRSFESIGEVGGASLNLTGVGQPEKLGTVRMTAEFLDVLGAKPQLGRWFLRAEEDRGAPNVVILSDSLWRRRFSSDPKIVGRRILLDGKAYEVVGVTLSGMQFIRERQLHRMASLPDRAELFIPLRLDQLDLTEPNWEYTAIARLKPGIGLERARAEIEATMPALVRELKEKVEVHAHLEPLLNALVGDTRKGLLVLLGAVGLMLLIVCVNVANLTLIRATGRRRELAIRTALGAGKRHLIGHSLAESALLAAAGTLLGLLLALWIMDFVIAHAPEQLPRLEELALDRKVLGFAMGLCVLTTILFGVLPALRAAGVSPHEALQAGSRGNTDGPHGSRLRAALVSVEVALSALLLIGAGLLLTSFHRVVNVSPGFQSENILSVDLSLPPSRYEMPQQRTDFFRRLRDSVISLPGVLHAGYISSLPLSENRVEAQPIVEGSSYVPAVERPMATWVSVSGSYFPAMGIPLRSGRLFEDQREKDLVGVVSETAARRLWPGNSPIGKRIRHEAWPPNEWLRVIGVVGDVRSAGLDQESEALIYIHYYAEEMSLVARTAIEPAAIAAALRQQVWKIDPEVPVPQIRTMARTVSNSVSTRRFQAVLVAAFAFVALLLASVGTYGVVAYTVVQRRGEIGVRLALGANPHDVKVLMLRRGMTQVGIGLIAGVVAAMALTRFMASLLFEVHSLDPLTFSVAPLLLLSVAAVACYVPARQAAGIDPTVALRYE